MIKTIHHIIAQNLKVRLKIPDTKDEIKRLSDTFNDMLERLDKAFTSQQRFIQDIYHELRTPLTVIKGELQEGREKDREGQSCPEEGSSRAGS